jgi:hypothetical protein
MSTTSTLEATTKSDILQAVYNYPFVWNKFHWQLNVRYIQDYVPF